MKKVENFFARTVRRDDDSAVESARQQFNLTAQSKGGELVSLEIIEPGVAVLNIKGDDAEAFVAAELGKLDGVKVSTISPFQLDYERNRARQIRADKMSATRKKEK